MFPRISAIFFFFVGCIFIGAPGMVSPRTTDAGDSGRMKSQAGSLGKNSTSQGSPLRNGLTQSDNSKKN